jgi:2-methylcitrate dehydratase PrpD
MSATDDLARFAATTTYASFPPAVRERAKHAIIDAIGTVAAGLNEPSVQHVRALAERETRTGQATVLGTPLRLAASGAALANGCAAHALDYDSISLTVSGFIASPVLFALLAVAEEIGGVSGERLLEAFITGWEAEAAIARGLGVHHYAKGWHSTATLGHFGAAIAVGRLLAFDTTRMRYAIGVAASEASGLRTMIGNMANPFHVGKAARNGVVAARLVESGFVAHADVLDTTWGFCAVFNGPGHYDLQAISASLGSTYDLLDPGLVIKVYPCCGLIHSALDGVLDLIERHGIAAADVRQATIAVHELVPKTMQFDHPATGYEAKFSTPFCVATALTERSVRLEHFTDARARDPAVQAVMAKIRMVVHPALHGADTFLENEFTEVTLELVDGRVFTERVRRIANRGSRDRPVTLDELESKFVTCAAGSGAEDAAQAAFGKLARLECIADIREVTAILYRCG